MCCQKTSPRVGIVEQSFEVTKGNEDGLPAIRSLTYEAKAWGDAKEASKEQGWKAVRGRGEPIPAANSFKNSNEALDFYNRYHNRKKLTEAFAKATQLVRESSMEINAEFDQLINEGKIDLYY